MPHPVAATAILLAAATAASAPVQTAPIDGIQLAQVSMTGRIIVRVESTPVAAAVMPVPIRWIEKKGPRCIAAGQLAGAIVNGTESVDLVMKGGGRVRADLDDDCAALGYYGGFYLKAAPDGQVCAQRDSIRTRSGNSCGIDRFKRLVAKPDKRRKP